MKDENASNDAPSLWRQVFVTPFTPTWTLGLLLFVCLFLPAYRGCNDQVLYLNEVITETESDPEDVYRVFLITWPFFLGALICLGTLWMLTEHSGRRARGLWCLLAIPIVLDMVLQVLVLATSEGEQPPPTTFEELRRIGWLLVPTIVLCIVLLVTFLRCRSWYTAAMWVQLALVITAAFSVTILTPGFLLAKSLLIGGHLAAAAAWLLIVTTVIQQLDGQRVLTRRRNDSPLQLSLRAMLLLMLLGGVVSAAIGSGWVVEFEKLAPEEPGASADSAPETPQGSAIE